MSPEAQRVTTPFFDFKDPDTWIDGAPHDAIAEVRRATPVYWNPEADGPGFWAVLRYEDIVAVSKQPDLFSSASANGGHRIFNENEVSVANTNDSSIGVPFISMDPPQHLHYRTLIVPGLSQARMADMESRIRVRAQGLVDALAPGESNEWVDAIAGPFPLMTLVELMGVPADDWRKLFHWTNAFIGEDDPEMRASPEDMADRMQEFGAYAHWLYASRKAEPGADIISMLANAVIDGVPMSFGDFLANMILLTVGANETTRNSISHGVCAFAANPEQWDKVRQSPEVLKTGTREIVRYASPVLHMRRTATADTTLGGAPVRKGDKVVLWYISGNRDETAIPEPHRFDISRTDLKHVGFGTGQHVCIGQRLAELQLRIMFETLAARFKRFEIVGAPSRLRSNFIHGLKSLHVRPVAA